MYLSPLDSNENNPFYYGKLPRSRSPLPRTAGDKWGEKTKTPAPPFLSPQMIPPSGNGGCWWRRCCSSRELSSSLVRVGHGQKGQEGAGGGLGCMVTEGQGLETPWARLCKLSTPTNHPRGDLAEPAGCIQLGSSGCSRGSCS